MEVTETKKEKAVPTPQGKEPVRETQRTLELRVMAQTAQVLSKETTGSITAEMKMKMPMETAEMEMPMETAEMQIQMETAEIQMRMQMAEILKEQVTVQIKLRAQAHLILLQLQKLRP